MIDFGSRAFAGSVSGGLTSVPQDKPREARGLPSGKLAVLRKHPIFGDLEPEALDQLSRYARHATFKRGAALFSKGDPGTSLFAVVSGTVKMSVSSADGRSAIFNLIGAGEISAKSRCSTGWRGPPMLPQTPIAKFWSWIGANFFPLCEASRRWR